MTDKNIKLSVLFSIHLLIISLYILLFSKLQITTSLMWQILGVFTNLLLGIILVRSVLNKITLYYSLLLFFLVYMFVFIGSPFLFLHRFSVYIISFLPVLVLHFLVLFFYGKYTKITKIFLIIQFFFSFIRSLLIFLGEPVSQYNSYFFFIGIILFYFFSNYLYFKGPRIKSLFTKEQKRRLLVSTVVSFTPFILFSLVPTVLTYQDSVVNHWTLLFFLVLPFTVADTLTKENLIYHQYWKASLIQNYISSSIFLITLNIMISILFNLSTKDSIILANFLMFFFFSSYIILLVFNKQKKIKITNQLLDFPEEKQFLTQQLLRNQHVESIKVFLLSILSIEINLKNLEIIIIDNNFYYADLQNWFKQTPSAIDDISEEMKRMERMKEEYSVLSMNGLFYLLLNVENYQTFLILEKEEEYLIKEKLLMEKIQPLLNNLFISVNKFSEVSFSANHQFYTPFEKSIFLKEVDLAEKYQMFVANYLHDEVLQSILAIRQSAYQKNDPAAVRHSIEETIEKIEISIRKKMIEWEPSNIPKQSLKDSVAELTQKLVIRFDKGVFVQIDIPESLDFPISFQQFIYRAIRELLINAYKHSNATKANVSLQMKKSFIILLVEDNGKGFENTIDLKNSDSSHFGLYSIYQQTHGLNGSMFLGKSKMGGTKIEMTFPSNGIMKGMS